MEILQPVRARGERWRIADLRTYDTARLVTLVAGARTTRLLTPFDDIEPIRQIDRPRPVSLRRWRRACRALIAADTPPASLRTATRARIDLLPHQLEPALAVLRGAGSRILLADDVGLGKTIQAGLIVSELLERGCVDRVLIVTPSGLRDQWAGELTDRFGITAMRAEARTLRELTSTLPPGVNPWTTVPVALTSIDYIKRPEVLPAVRDVLWDVVIVDEAHGVSGDSDRRVAIDAVAARAAYVVLLTATPHNGDDAAFDLLCRTGAISSDSSADPIIVFRRTRNAIRGGEPRHVHVLPVRQSQAERHMFAAFEPYQRAVEAEHGQRALVLSVLEKRALSSPWSLAQSVDRRLAMLAEDPPTGNLQLSLPLDDPDGDLLAEDAPPVWPADLALSDAREDRRLLTAVAAAARTAAIHDESKVRVLRRLLTRVQESALVFTEYRDTALHVASAIGPRAGLLHGGMDRRERFAALDAFTRTPGSVLVATDAAGQGLNLHRSCRLVINVELPWNPMRLEQRIGRVDRIGQLRRVHAVHLVADGTAERGVLERLNTRIQRAKSRIGAPDPLRHASIDSDDASWSRPAARVDPRIDACAEATRIGLARTLSDGSATNGPPEEPCRPLIVRAKRSKFRRALAGRSLLIYRIACEDRDGRIVESRLLSLLVEGSPRFEPGSTVAESTIQEWGRQLAAAVKPFWTTRALRETEIASRPQPTLPLIQPALFDRHIERLHSEANARRTETAHQIDERRQAVDRRMQWAKPVVRLLLVATR